MIRVVYRSVLSCFLLLGCAAPETPAPKAPQDTLQTTGLKARDYFFPASGTTRASYVLDYLTELATESMRATGSLTIEVLRYTPTQALLQLTSLESGDTEPFVATASLFVEPDGSIREEEGETRRYSDAIFSVNGGILSAASGSEIPELRATMVGPETIRTPAGSFATVRLQEKLGVPDSPTSNVWVAKGIGVVRRSSVMPIPLALSPSETKMGTASFEMQLVSFQP